MIIDYELELNSFLNFILHLYIVVKAIFISFYVSLPVIVISCSNFSSDSIIVILLIIIIECFLMDSLITLFIHQHQFIQYVYL